MDERGREVQFEPFGRPLADWVRFDRYELRDGVIRPVKGARLERYDPWEAYRAARSGWGGGGGQAPYESLLELAWSGRLLPGRRDEPPVMDLPTDRAVLEWCARHGLLGVLPHEAEVAYLAPRWLRPPMHLADGLEIVPLRRSYAWKALGWRPGDDIWWRTQTPELINAPKPEGELVPKQFQAEWWQPPHVLGRGLQSGIWTTVPLGEAWGRFFPDVPATEKETHAYPLPLSDEFWIAYGEPVRDFLSAAEVFHQTLEGLFGGIRPGEKAIDMVARFTAADGWFFNLTAGIHPVIGRKPDGGYERAWRAKSLLASFAMMAYLDMTEGKRVLDCEVCGKPFVSGAYQARYCSARCRNTAMKRAYRARQRDRAEPETVTEDEGTMEPIGDERGRR